MAKQWYSGRIEILLLSFNLILLIKSISAGYTASYLSIKNPQLLEDYMNILQIAPLFFVISFMILAVPLFLKGEKVRKICDISGISLIIVGLLYIYLARGINGLFTI